MDRVLEFRAHIFSLKIVYHELPELSLTQVRRLNQPLLQLKSLQSRTLLSLVRHMSGAAFEWGLSCVYTVAVMIISVLTLNV